MKVGDYVRTKDGRIYKIGDIGNFIYSEDDVIIQGIIKSSPNIIDLIEEDDYVNGKLVVDIITNKNGKRLHLNMYPYEEIKNEDIKSIVTKEQFEAMKYEIK